VDFFRHKCYNNKGDKRMNLYEETKFIMKKNNLYANKSLGQNFLIDDNVVLGIVKTAEICKNDLVIEIGPGLRYSYKIFIRS